MIYTKYIRYLRFLALIDCDNDYLSPSICGKMTDRLCGYGPPLQFLFDIDEEYTSTAEKILNYFNVNFEAVCKYLRRVEYVYDIYKENENLDRKIIKNETSKYKTKRSPLASEYIVFC